MMKRAEHQGAQAVQFILNISAFIIYFPRPLLLRSAIVLTVMMNQRTHNAARKTASLSTAGVETLHVLVDPAGTIRRGSQFDCEMKFAKASFTRMRLAGQRRG